MSGRRRSRFSTAWRSAFAGGEVGVGDEVRQPGVDRGRKKPVAKPATAARATIARRSRANGSAQKTAERSEVGADHQPRRENRSTSGPSRRPITTAGRKSAIRSALTQFARVRPRVDVDRERDDREPGADPGAERGEEEAPEGRRPTRSAAWTSEKPAPANGTTVRGARQEAAFGRSGAEAGTRPRRRDAPERGGEERVLLGRPDVTRIASGAPNPCSGRTITPSRSSRSKSGRASSPRSAKTKFADRAGRPARGRARGASARARAGRPAFSPRRRASSRRRRGSRAPPPARVS